MTCLDSLRFNMADLPTSYKTNAEIKSNISGVISEHLGYCIYHWTKHLYEPDILRVTRVLKFLETKALFWLEGLSLLQDISQAEKMMTDLGHWDKVCQNQNIGSLAQGLARTSNYKSGPMISLKLWETLADAWRSPPPIYICHVSCSFRRLVDSGLVSGTNFTPKQGA